MNKVLKSSVWGWWFIALLLVFSIAIIIPFKSALQFGGDDGMELGKAFQYWGPGEWRESMWNDQPPLYSWILAGAFHLFGPEAWAARLVSAGFLVVLLVSVVNLLPPASGTSARLLAIFIVMAISPVCQLGFSVMQELPCMALACASLAWIRKPPLAPGRVFVSGMLFGAAVQIKYVALLLAPAGFALMWMLTERQENGLKAMWWNLKAGSKWMSLWGAAMASTVLFVIVLSGRFDWSQLWTTHAKSAQAEEAGRLVFAWREVIAPWWLWLLLITGTVAVIRNRRWADLAFPWIALITVTAVHSLHRPWWPFYQIHFVIPVALWAGIGWDALWNRDSGNELQSVRDLRLGGYPLWGALASVCLALAGGLRGLGDQVKSLASASPVEHLSVIPEMRRYAKETRWIYTRDNIFAFSARLPIPPNLLILSKKRFWSGQIREKDILKLVRQYLPEQLLLAENRELLNPEWRQFVEKDYVELVADGQLVLFVHRRLNPAMDEVGKPQQANLLSSLRLTGRKKAPLQPILDAGNPKDAVR